MIKRNWGVLPYNHAGRWEKKFESIWDPSSKVNFIGVLVEAIVWCRSKVPTKNFECYSSLKRGKGWSRPIAKEVRNLAQQAVTICNWFPHPDDEPLVEVAFRNHLRKVRPLSIGGYRKTRSAFNTTQAEKDFVNGVQLELDKLMEDRNRMSSSTPIEIEETKTPISRVSTQKERPKNKLLMIMEQEAKESKETKNE